MNLLDLFIESVFSKNILLIFFLGMCSYLMLSKSMKTAVGLGLAVTVVQTLTVPLNYLIYAYVLRENALSWLGIHNQSLIFLNYLLYISLIATIVQVVEMVLNRWFPALSMALGIYLPLIAVNCAIFGGALFMQQRNYNLAESVVFGVGSGLGWALAIILIAAIRERLKYSFPPLALRGLGIAFVVTGLMAMAFQTFSGL